MVDLLCYSSPTRIVHPSSPPPTNCFPKASRTTCLQPTVPRFIHLWNYFSKTLETVERASPERLPLMRKGQILPGRVIETIDKQVLNGGSRHCSSRRPNRVFAQMKPEK
ncbi:hypothetical protein ZHAS_00014117 [Anopheles sinensis]|uniref:Uncharacterized protein n=1 Tax=Anopheles sinensis TaxID=74873 RepID=A0A084W7N6_ANOSI|nr:hypothetical protein ZHAS_00014117 [Anopheles sinensis]